MRGKARIAVAIALAASACSGAGDDADPASRALISEEQLEEVRRIEESGVLQNVVEEHIVDRIRDVVDSSDWHSGYRNAVLDVRAEGCGPREIFGTASLVGDEHAVTAAHVVAGAAAVTVIDADGEASSADVVLFDPDLDIAVLRTQPDIGVPLGFYDGDIDAGLAGLVAFARFESGTVDVRTAPVEVVRHVNIETTDIYLDAEVTRPGFEIEASIDPGDSGAVVVIAGGAAGIIWARSTQHEGRAWAVDIPEVIRDPSGRRALIDPVDTGRCPR